MRLVEVIIKVITWSPNREKVALKKEIIIIYLKQPLLLRNFHEPSSITTVEGKIH
jgi:hypothetical protein